MNKAGADLVLRHNDNLEGWGRPPWNSSSKNMRQPSGYRSMLASGDFELMTSVFYMFCNNLQLAEERTRRYYGHEGAHFPKTITSSHILDPGYRREREGKPASRVDHSYLRHYVNLRLLPGASDEGRRDEFRNDP